jgi:hypothetical protein
MIATMVSNFDEREAFARRVGFFMGVSDQCGSSGASADPYRYNDFIWNENSPAARGFA